MAFTMMATAGAAYTDQADIEATEAVDVLNALGVMTGDPNGSFRPNDTITRAEACRMIYTIRNNGNDDASAYAGMQTTFTDVPADAWYAGYVKHCQSVGIVSGKSSTIFDPNSNVTGVELALMCLRVMGYDPAKADIGGSTWSITTIGLATEAGLLDNVNTAVEADCPRQWAAQLMYNMLDTSTVRWSDDLGGYSNTYADGSKYETVGAKYMGLQEWIGSFEGNHDVAGVGNDDQITVKGSIDGKHKASGWNGTKGGDNASFEYTLSNDYVGEEVSVLFKDGKNGTDNQPDDKDTIYGVYVTGNTSVINAIADDIDKDSTSTTKVTVDDKEYKVAEDGKIVKNFVDAATGTPWTSSVAKGIAAIKALSATNGDTVKFILNDNSEITKVYVTNYYITKVTAVNSSKVSLNGIGSLTIEDNDIYEGVAKDDVVVYTKLYDDAKYFVTKAESVEGTLDGYKEGTAKAIEAVTIDGTTYNTMNEKLVGGLTDDDKTTLNTGDIGEAVTAYMVNGFVGCIDMPASSSNYALVTGVGTGTVGGVDEFKMKVLLADGTEKTVTVDEDSINPADSKAFEKGDFAEGDLVKYASISDSNVMDVTAVAKTYASALTATAANNLYDKDTKSFAQNAAVSTYAVSTSDAVLFVGVQNDEGKVDKYYAYNMRSLGNIKAVTSPTATKFYSQPDDDNKVVAAYVELASKPTGATTDTIYGIVTAANGTVKVGDEYKKSFTVANDQESYAVYMSNSSSKLSKGDIVSFDKASDDIYVNDDVTVYTAANAKYIKELDSDNVLSYYDAIGGKVITQALDDDAQIVYVDQDNDAAGDNIGVNEYDKIDKYANAVVVLDSSKTKISAIIVESSGECNVVNGMAIKNAPTAYTDTTNNNGAELKKEADGIYTVANIVALPDEAAAHNAADMLVFKFTASTTSSAYTLKIGTTLGDDDTYLETSSAFDDGAGHYFYIDKTGAYNTAGTSGTLKTGAPLKAGTVYYYQITNASSAVVLSGSFVA